MFGTRCTEWWENVHVGLEKGEAGVMSMHLNGFYSAVAVLANKKEELKVLIPLKELAILIKELIPHSGQSDIL